MKATIQTSTNSNNIVTLDGTAAEITAVIKGILLSSTRSTSSTSSTSKSIVDTLKKDLEDMGYIYDVNNFRSCNRVVNKYPKYISNMPYPTFIQWYKGLFTMGFFTFSGNKELQKDSLESYYNLALRLSK